MWDLLGLGIEPVSPTLAGGFFTTEPPEKPMDSAFFTTKSLDLIPDQGTKIPQAKQSGPKKEGKKDIKWKDIFL